ncbi:hypothetical protein HDG34_005936 [Paraburkholderia sp. HC6.4b]|uniref:hypothetical protein n=1 Tax=unclassified Paraburkholderia TaxID=2615204 RepID=UPI00161C57D1|nr:MULTISPECIES: hypothetical protein [unclassified Paraburkholderia]MBB5411970.1 hypothetical protein [Paraburkholderia sp. HC6.4b]MBB5454037.1 hypothetical protein [Paraburkholderia sp. Kb1A]
MSDAENTEGKESQKDHLSETSFWTIFRQLTASELAGIGAVLFAVIGATFAVGQRFSPDLDALKEKNATLTASLTSTEIVGDQNRTLAIDEFVIGPSYDTSGLTSLFDDRLFVAPLPAGWKPFKANDLTLLATLIGATDAEISAAMPATFIFNNKNPPKIWTLDDPAIHIQYQNRKQGFLTPYIQISVISRERAQELMKSINKDGNSLAFKGLDAAQDVANSEFHGLSNNLVDERFRQLRERSFPLQVFFKGAFTSQEQDTIFENLSEQQREEKIERIGGELEDRFLYYTEIPLQLVGNGMESLTRVTPETGLLFGRLLFYVFGVSGEGRIDVERLVSNYSGSYARLRRSISVGDGKEDATAYVYDDVLILASKSDFCLVHIRVPVLDDRLKQVEHDAQTWLRQVRMREFR